ncbi:Glutaminyl-tRNA synthetase, partial [Coemansia sp. RSA 2671]
MAELIAKFEALGLSADKAKEAAGNKKLAPTLDSLIASTGQAEFTKPTGMLIYSLATTAAKDKTPHADYIARAIVAGRIASTEQLSAATKFCAKNDPSAEEAAFNEACGVGIVVSDEAIAASVKGAIDSFKENLVKERYRALGKVLGAVKKLPELRWADSGKVKAEFDAQTLALLGPKDERDTPAAAKAAAAATAAPKVAVASSTTETSKWKPASLESMLASGDISRLHKPGENPQIKPELTKAHLAATKGSV